MRQQSHRIDEGATSVAPFSRFDSGASTWASFNGREICPDCQTAEERREAALRVAAMIEREIERRQADGISSDAYEAGLVAYAMAIRQSAGADDPETAEAPSWSSGTSVGAPANRGDSGWPTTGSSEADGRQLSVAFTGAFLTGHPLNVRTDGYQALQDKLSGELSWPQWRLHTAERAERTFQGGGGFTRAMPLVIARREGADLLPLLSEPFGASGCSDALETFRPLVRARPTRLAIDVYDLGVAVMTAWFDVLASPNANLGAIARALKLLAGLRPDGTALSPLVLRLQEIARETTQQYIKAITTLAPEQVQPDWLSGGTTHAADGPYGGKADDEGRLLWLHPVSVLCLPAPSPTSPVAAEDDDAAAALADVTASDPAKAARELAPAVCENIKLDGGAFAAGIGWSAIAVLPQSKAHAAPVRLTELHWAYYALYMEIDRGLLRVLEQDKWNKGGSLRDLEKDSQNAFTDYLRVVNARARLDSDLNSRGGDELAIWEAISRVQRFDAIVTGVERKLNVLQEVAQRRVAQTTEARARLTSNILGFLSLLTVVTVAGALIGIFLGSTAAENTSLTPRLVAIVVAFLVAGLVFWGWVLANDARRSEIQSTTARSLGSRRPFLEWLLTTLAASCTIKPIDTDAVSARHQ